MCGWPSRVAALWPGVCLRTWLSELFERLNRPEDVSFRYTIFDSGRGRELQNQPFHNIAGLGIASGERPFKRLARPMVFLPRSTIRVRIEERFGRGTLFIVFQGYKILGARSATGRAMNAAPPVNGLHGLGQTAPRGATRRTIPFDYSFQFVLQGRPGLVQNSTITVSTEASFTVLSIGYGVVPKVSPIKFGLTVKPVPPPPIFLLATSQLALSEYAFRLDRRGLGRSSWGTASAVCSNTTSWATHCDSPEGRNQIQSRVCRTDSDGVRRFRVRPEDSGRSLPDRRCSTRPHSIQVRAVRRRNGARISERANSQHGWSGVG